MECTLPRRENGSKSGTAAAAEPAAGTPQMPHECQTHAGHARTHGMHAWRAWHGTAWHGMARNGTCTHVIAVDALWNWPVTLLNTRNSYLSIDT